MSDNQSQRTTRRSFLALAGTALTVSAAGCLAGSPTECPDSSLKTTDEDALIASISIAGYYSDIEFTVNFWQSAGTDTNPVAAGRLFDANGKSLGEFDVPAGVRSTTASLSKPDTETAVVRVYAPDGRVLETRALEVSC